MFRATPAQFTDPAAPAIPAMPHAVPGWAAFVCTDEGAGLARAAFDLLELPESALRGGGLSGAARISGTAPVAQRLLVEMGKLSVEMACDAVTEIRASGAEVVVLGHDQSLDTYRKLRRAGALDYLALPALPEDIIALDEQLDAAPQVATLAPVQPQTPRVPVIGIVGASGGVGASQLALNLAIQASRAKGQPCRTALVDADLRFGSLALDLDTAETPGLIEALSAPSRVDGTFLDATMLALTETLSLYACQPGGSAALDNMDAALPHLVTPLRDSFDAVVLDLPRAVLLSEPQLARDLDALIMVVPAGYAGINAACRLTWRLRQAVPDLRLVPVVSELRRDAGLSVCDMSEALEREIAAVLPRCDAPMHRAHRAGKALVEMQPRSRYAKVLSGLWSEVTSPAKANVQSDKAPRRLAFKALFG